ncbi:MAG: AAA family ATPase [Flavobacteriales bacterium]|nr:AAA family ATPase [Flavobacteriales bacterium]
MRISKVIVENYRSICRAEIESSAFNVFVGQNNHGKTNF